MPSVSPPSDGGYQYYQKNISELEDELRNEAKRARERMDERTQSMEEAHRKDLERRDRDLEETIENIRKNSNDTISRERENAQAEVKKLKNDTYDKFGRFGGNESDVMAQQLESLQADSQIQNEKNQRNLTEAEERHEAAMHRASRDAEERAENAIRAARESANETYSKAYRSEASAYDEFRKDAEKKQEESIKEHQRELHFERKRAEQAINDARLSYERKARLSEDSNEERFAKLSQNSDEQARKSTARLNSSQEQANRILRSQIGELLENERSFHREKGEGRQQAIDEYDNEWRTRERVIADQFLSEIDSIKAQGKESERYFNHLNNQTLREKDRYFAKIISQVNEENHREKKDLEATYGKDRAQQETRILREREIARNTLDSQLQKASEDRDEALHNQAKAYQDTMQRQRSANQEEVRRLERSIAHAASSEDASVVSPAAEAAIRKTVRNQYEKTLNAESNRHRGAVDSMQQEYVRRLDEAAREREISESGMRRQYLTEKKLEQDQFLAHIQNVEYTKEEAMRHKDYESAKTTALTNRTYATILESQRREFNNTVQAIKDEAGFRMAASRQEHQFELENARRDFLTKQNELIRTYDKRLMDQKRELETKIADLTSERQLAIRDAERKTKLALEEQKLSYEQRMAQAEQQSKERERYLTENFEEQLEKVRRSNALLIKKKS